MPPPKESSKDPETVAVMEPRKVRCTLVEGTKINIRVFAHPAVAMELYRNLCFNSQQHLSVEWNWKRQSSLYSVSHSFLLLTHMPAQPIVFDYRRKGLGEHLRMMISEKQPLTAVSLCSIFNAQF